VFLDEPFKMMDQERTLEALEILRSVSPDLRQFFVIQPEYLEVEREFFDCWVRASRDRDRLELGCP
jgi:hypothetical protein